MTALFDSTQLILEIDRPLVDQSWQRSQAYATASSQWNAYLNQICLGTVLPWLREEYEPRASAYPNRSALSSFWELVNGTAIQFGDSRAVLIPVEAIDQDEFRIPQEWVDIPDWAADYYIPVQVDVDDGSVRICGFMTHRQLKTKAQRDFNDRTYCLDSADLTPEMSALWIARELAPEEVMQAELQPLPTLVPVQAENLIQRLASASIMNPRLSVPFETWGALIQHGGWRQQLAERRRGLPEQRSLSQWLQQGVSTIAEQMGWGQIAFQPETVGARGTEASESSVGLARQLTIANQLYELRILPLDTDAGRVWRFELRPLAPGGRIPPHYTLRLLTEDLQPFEGNEDSAIAPVEELFVEVMLEPGEGIVWEVEPTPEEFDREILRF